MVSTLFQKQKIVHGSECVNTLFMCKMSLMNILQNASLNCSLHKIIVCLQRLFINFICQAIISLKKTTTKKSHNTDLENCMRMTSVSVFGEISLK